MLFKKIPKTLGVILTLSLSISLLGCGPSKTDNKAVTKDLSNYELDSYEENIDSLGLNNKLKAGEKVIIGFSMDSLKEPIWKVSRDAFISRAKELGAEVRVEQANSDDRLQLAQIDQLIAEGVNVLVVAPHDGEVTAEAAEKAHNAGIKLIAYDRLIKNSDVDLYVALDSFKAGELQAQELLKNVKSGNVAYVGGSPSDNNAILFRSGAMKVLESNKDSINIVMDKYSTDWKAEEAYNNVMDLLTTDSNIQGIVCANDGTASGAIAALEKFSLVGKIPVTGLDSELSACQRIVEGKQLMTIYKPTNEMASKAAELAVKMAKGETVEANNKIFNGKIDVQAYYLDPIVVTKENMVDTVVKYNFQSFEDVYKNVPEDQRPKQ
ncbi:sugar ABC transporter substrate-binding protein [Clostridium vincentii]|uniref:D-xylose-binding periplasmic protein n=1 Tax=Clostridium vincentii TaxID=52704 RepID=A0A2T0BIH2_9CLOT|nr:substrate-binding domain-containing protein [Clostridium vincentii]PRR83647.1 D-xylose-binding periplasmic protein precursor [Clostridium vincentii]